jgi:hypothetical protein
MQEITRDYGAWSIRMHALARGEIGLGSDRGQLDFATAWEASPANSEDSRADGWNSLLGWRHRRAERCRPSLG